MNRVLIDFVGPTLNAAAVNRRWEALLRRLRMIGKRLLLAPSPLRLMVASTSASMGRRLPSHSRQPAAATARPRDIGLT